MVLTLKIYPVVLQLVCRLSPYLPALRARSTSLGRENLVRIRTSHSGYHGRLSAVLVRCLDEKLRHRGGGQRAGDQLERALISVPLNLAEGAYIRGKNRYARYQSAAASAREALACLETAKALGCVAPLELGALFQQVIGTLVRLGQSRR
jgi:four helix bundle protein